MTARVDDARRADALVVRAARGDQAAFAELYDATSPRLYGLAMRLLSDPAQALDVTADCYAEIWRSARDFDPEGASALAWMTALLHTRAVAQRRRNDLGAGVIATAPEPSRTDGAAQTDTARALELTYFHGRTHTETAALLDLPVPAVDELLRQRA